MSKSHQKLAADRLKQEEEAIHKASRRYEIRGGMVADGILMGIALLVVIMAIFDRSQIVESGYYKLFIGIYLSTAVFLGVNLYLQAKKLTRPWMKFFVLFMQISTISASVSLDVWYDRVNFIFGPILMMAYCFIIGLTAFRLSPALSMFAGLLASIEVLLINFIMVQPLIHQTARPDLLEEYGPIFMLFSIAIMATMGCAFSVAAKNVLKTLHQQIRDAMRRQQVEFLFGRYVSPEIAEAALHHGGMTTPRLAHAAVLFCDIREFTAFSQGKSPAIVVGLVEECWSKACEIVAQEGGIVNKFLGDGLMVLFGVPTSRPGANFIADAARAGLRLSQELDVILNRESLQLCVGIHEGEVIAGEIGPGSRCEYTVFGEVVNLASRIEHQTRPLNKKILISETVSRSLPDTFKTVSLGPQVIHGISTPVELYELVSETAK